MPIVTRKYLSKFGIKLKTFNARTYINCTVVKINKETMHRVICVTLVALSITPFAGAQVPYWPAAAGILNCSAFGMSASNVSRALQNWESRLHACFDANPYDTEHLPLAPTAMPLQMLYDWALINLISFDNGILKVFFRLLQQVFCSILIRAIFGFGFGFYFPKFTSIYYKGLDHMCNNINLIISRAETMSSSGSEKINHIEYLNSSF